MVHISPTSDSSDLSIPSNIVETRGAYDGGSAVEAERTSMDGRTETSDQASRVEVASACRASLIFKRK